MMLLSKRASLHLAAAVLAAGMHGPSNAQQIVTRITQGDCTAFGYYILEDAREFGKDMSRTFLMAASRFVNAGCATRDADGEIQLITETRQDAISFRTARSRMGKVDILTATGVKHCHRPTNGFCPTASRSR